MPLDFYSPRAKGDGGALFVSFNSKEETATFSFIAQTGWDTEKKQGSFKGGTKINVIFNRDELGGMISALETRGEFPFYHTFEGVSCSGSLKFYEAGDKRGFGVIINKGESKVKVGLTLASAQTLRQYLIFILHHIFSAIYARDKKEAEARKAAEKAPAAVSDKPEEPPEPEKEKEEDGDLF